MNLNKSLKLKIVTQFKTGSSMAECAQWYSKTILQIEGVIREYMIKHGEKLSEELPGLPTKVITTVRAAEREAALSIVPEDSPKTV